MHNYKACMYSAQSSHSEFEQIKENKLIMWRSCCDLILKNDNNIMEHALMHILENVMIHRSIKPCL